MRLVPKRVPRREKLNAAKCGMQVDAETRRMVVDRRIFGWLAGANAQTPSPPTAVTQFDSTYAPVSATKVNETYMTTGTTRIGQCPDCPRLNPLIRRKNHEYRGNNHELFAEGTVGPHGELTMRYIPTPFWWMRRMHARYRDSRQRFHRRQWHSLCVPVRI
jgi:hypothetical protein